MLPHHDETIRRTVDFFARQPGTEALLLGGSIAHGFHHADSDVDVMILVSDQEHEERRRTGTTCFFSRELCTYPGGYVDGKYTSRAFLREVEARGSEPARFAFQDARILFTRDDRLSELITRAARYPVADKASRIWRFQAQFEAWNWYAGEALKRQNLHLLRVAIAKLTLFGGRLVLAHNELLYPYHKWFLRVLETAPDKPPGLLDQIDVLTRAPTAASIETFATSIRRFRPWEISHATWPAQFMEDSELNWLHQPVPVDDL